MKINLLIIDRLILFLLSYVVFVDMINGFFAIEFTKLPISQGYKFILLVLILLRLSASNDIGFILILLFAFQIGPLTGWLKTGDFTIFLQDVIVATKWLIVPVSFFYFKNLFQGPYWLKIKDRLILVVKRAFGFITLNMALGFFGFGMAFYNHGYNNAVGTKGYIFAGNELTIMVLAVGYIIAVYYWQKEAYRKFVLAFFCFLVYSFLITSKTVLGGVMIIFLIPIISTIKLSIKKKWLDWLTALFFLGIPVLVVLFYIGIAKSGVIEKFRHSLKRNDYDLLTVLVSNRNNFVERGWEVYVNEYPLVGKLFGYGQKYHLELSGHSAEVDFLSLLFASGIVGILFLLLLLVYWGLNASKLKRIGGYVYAKPTLIFLWFIIVAANLSGHVFGSGIAGFFIGLALALMFYNSKKLLDESIRPD